MIGFALDAVLTHFGGEPIRDLHITVSAPRSRTDGRFDCTVESSEPELSQAVTDEHSEMAYFRALNHVRQTLIDREQGVFDRQGRALWFDPPLRYPGPHGGFAWPSPGRWRPSFPRASFVGTLPGPNGLREFSIRIGRPRFTGPFWRSRFSVSLFYTGGLVKLRMFGDWPEEAYCYAFRIARREIGFWGDFIDAQGNPIKVTAPIPTVETGC